VSQWSGADMCNIPTTAAPMMYVRGLINQTHVFLLYVGKTVTKKPILPPRMGYNGLREFKTALNFCQNVVKHRPKKFAPFKNTLLLESVSIFIA
ncbi:MAG: hypothetical protein ACREBJ_05800, partial [Nitrosotalea sp.]